MENKTFLVREESCSPVSIDTHFTAAGVKRGRPLNIVTHLIAAYFPSAAPSVIVQYELYERGLNGEEILLDFGQSLEPLPVERPLVIRKKASQTFGGFGIFKSLWFSSSSSTRRSSKPPSSVSHQNLSQARILQRQ
jgi:hypothetical protein